MMKLVIIVIVIIVIIVNIINNSSNTDSNHNSPTTTTTNNNNDNDDNDDNNNDVDNITMIGKRAGKPLRVLISMLNNALAIVCQLLLSIMCCVVVFQYTNSY